VQRAPANSGGWRLFVAGLALIAFAFQSYLTQTHIHLAPPVISAEHGGLASVTKAAEPMVKFDRHTAPKRKAPDDEDPAKCPLCQAVGYAGHFVTPSSAALLLPISAISILPLAITIVSPRESPSHIWQGRGPPNS
jgi:hypothetical protein